MLTILYRGAVAFFLAAVAYVLASSVAVPGDGIAAVLVLVSLVGLLAVPIATVVAVLVDAAGNR